VVAVLLVFMGVRKRAFVGLAIPLSLNRVHADGAPGTTLK
jgi:hypothetical protein